MVTVKTIEACCVSPQKNTLRECIFGESKAMALCRTLRNRVESLEKDIENGRQKFVTVHKEKNELLAPCVISGGTNFLNSSHMEGRWCWLPFEGDFFNHLQLCRIEEA